MDTDQLIMQISNLEQEIIAKKTELYNLKKQMPRFEVKDYLLHDKEGVEIRLSDLFGDKNEMILVHNMGSSCPYCTLWADGFIGIYKHLSSRASFVVSSPDDHQHMKSFSDSRGWNFPIVSTAGSSLKKDLGFELKDGSYYPGVSSLYKDADNKIWHVAKAFFGPGDDFCSVWYFFDMLAQAQPDWEPQFNY